jgi:hypothetical protein
MKVELENLSKRWGDVVGADSMTLDDHVADGGGHLQAHRGDHPF